MQKCKSHFGQTTRHARRFGSEPRWFAVFCRVIRNLYYDPDSEGVEFELQVAPSCSALRVRLIVRYGISRCLENTEPSASANNQTNPRISLHNGRALRGARRPTSLPYPRALCIPQTCAVQLHAQHDTSPHASPNTCVTFLMRVHTTGNVKRSSNASSIKLINDRAARQRLNQLV